MSDQNKKNNLDRYIGLKVKKYRQDKRITRSIIAAKLGLTEAEYTQSENGTRRFSARELVELVALLGVTVDDLYPSYKEDWDAGDKVPTNPDEQELYDLVHYYTGIGSADLRKTILAQIKRISSFKA